MELRQQQTDSISATIDSTVADSGRVTPEISPVFGKTTAQTEAATAVQDSVLPRFFGTEFRLPIAAKPRVADADGWILPVLMLFFFAIALINLAFPRALLQIVTAAFRLDGIRKIQSDENDIMRKAMQLMHLVYVFLFPVFAYQLLQYGHLEFSFFSSIPIYWTLFFISGGLLAGKIILVSITGYLFNCMEESTNYRHGILVMNCLLTFVMIPLCLSLKISPAVWAPYLVAAGLAFFGLFYLLSLGIGVLAGLRSKTVSKFHLILYFCALEAIPVFLILKIAKTFI